LRDKWMVISTDDKRQRPLTASNRIKVGEKGIGRLALDRLCENTVIVTHRKGSKGSGLKVEIDWTKYDRNSGNLHEIKHPVSKVQVDGDASSGTTLYLTRLRDRWEKRDYEKLEADLSLLV